MIGDPRLDRWLVALLATPGLTAIDDPAEAHRVHVEDALSAVDLIEAGPVVDVGSGGGSPGLPLAAALPDLRFDLLESSRRKCAFLRDAAREFANVGVICARAEEHARGAGRDAYRVAVTRALAPPPVAVEWCLPLVAVGGILILYATAAGAREQRVAQTLGASSPRVIAVPDSESKSLYVFRKLEPTPPRFPRRAGVARRRPLA